MDWSNVDGEQIHLGLRKLSALDTSRRIGNLFYNLGGPGQAATELLDVLAEQEHQTNRSDLIFSREIRDRFDIIGLDPRGVGRSAQIRCSPELLYGADSLYVPDDEAAFDKMVKSTELLGASCRNLTGPLLNFVDTLSVVRDLEAVRVALNDGPLTYIGVSYGTQLGYQYASMFPYGIRAMALDAVAQHSDPDITQINVQSAAMDRALQRFFTWCNTNSACAAHNQSAEKLWDETIARGLNGSIPSPTCNQTRPESHVCHETLSVYDIVLHARSRLGHQLTWSLLAEELLKLLSGNSTLLRYLKTVPPLDSADNNFSSALLAINCQDSDRMRSFEEYLAMKQIGHSYPRVLGITQGWYTAVACIGWPAPVRNPPRKENFQDVPPILLVHALYDSVTPYEDAVVLKNEIKNAVLVTRDGDGHGSYFSGKGETKALVDDFFVNLTLPDDGVVTTT
jgi:pimeloyl-ACP methyl ester carboxylesterase